MANKKDLANGVVSNNPGSSGTTIDIASYGSYMPSTPFYATVCPTDELSTPGNSEIVSVTARSGDSLTVTRAQKSTTAKNISEGWILVNGVYTDDISTGGGTWGSITGALSSQTDLQSALDDKLDDSQLDTDGTLTANSDTKVASQKATKTYVDNLDTDDIAEGSTNLYSQWAKETSGGQDFIRPTDHTDALLVGKEAHSSIPATFSGAAAVFNGSVLATDDGVNYFANLAYGTGWFAFGSLFVTGRAQGTATSPTQTLAGDILGGYTFTGFNDVGAWEMNGTNHMFPGLWGLAPNDVTESALDPIIWIGGLISPMVKFSTSTNAITFNEAQMDSDITFYSSSDISMVLDSGTGQVTINNLYASSTIELGNATDTTLSRSSAGVLAVEGVAVPTISSTDTLTNKRITPRVSTEASSATPTINTDNVDMHTITALATNITSMTTNLSGTPTNGQKLLIRIKDDGSARTITWGASYNEVGVTLPTTTTASKTSYIEAIYNSASSKWDVLLVNTEA